MKISTYKETRVSVLLFFASVSSLLLYTFTDLGQYTMVYNVYIVYLINKFHKVIPIYLLYHLQTCKNIFI